MHTVKWFQVLLCNRNNITSVICLHTFKLIYVICKTWICRYFPFCSKHVVRSGRYPAKTTTDADYADDIAILVNAPTQAETLLYSLERAAAGIGLHVNADKTEYMCFNPTGDISTLNGSSLKLADRFTYLGSSVSSTETDIDTRQIKAWTSINSLLVIWKSDLTDKIKRSFFQTAIVSILLYGCTAGEVGTSS